MSASTLTNAQETRKKQLGVLARSEVTDLEFYWQPYADKTEFSHLREPEIGLVMVRGRAGGSGQRFNLGEMTVSRCSVAMADGTIGHGYVKGRNRRHAELVALFDALGQQDSNKISFLDDLATQHKNARALQSAKVAATKVEFYTMVRGED